MILWNCTSVLSLTRWTIPSPQKQGLSGNIPEWGKSSLPFFCHTQQSTQTDYSQAHSEVTPVPFEKLSDTRKAESSTIIRERVTRARTIQAKRFELMKNVHYNAQMSSKLIREYCALDEVSLGLIKTAMERLNLSARAYDRILKVSRTIADLEVSKDLKVFVLKFDLLGRIFT